MHAAASARPRHPAVDCEASKAPGGLAEANITYAKPRDVARVCKKKQFARVPETKAVVRFKLEGDKVVAEAPEKFVDTDY